MLRVLVGPTSARGTSVPKSSNRLPRLIVPQTLETISESQGPQGLPIQWNTGGQDEELGLGIQG